ncbi:polymer-forming cytoskeletal protein [Bacillus infantis]|uniref:polymer-forming cytoskeletal protein n=1 Tax=Bacillus infantis TaxID=324767 RepID=UPI003CFB262B
MILQGAGKLSINGIGSSDGGSYDKVCINGKGTVNGNIECRIFDCNGSGQFDGDVLSSEKAKINGNAAIAGSFSGATLSIDGSAGFSGNVAAADEIKVNGKGRIGGKLASRKIIVNGRLTAGGSVETEEFISEGQFIIGSHLAAESIKSFIMGECKVQEMRGRSILIRKKKDNPLRGLLQSFFPSRLEAALIEGEEIHLENTNVKMVRGNHIVIGENAIADTVEYTGSLKFEGNGTALESRKI